MLDAESGEIVSSFYGRRYRVHIDPADEAQRRRWREARARAPARAGAQEGEA